MLPRKRVQVAECPGSYCGPRHANAAMRPSERPQVYASLYQVHRPNEPVGEEAASMAVAVDHLKRSAATSRRQLGPLAPRLVNRLHFTLNLPATGRVIRLRRMRQSKISAATSAAPTVLFMVIVRPFQFHVSDLVRRCLTARLADPPLVSILNYLHHPFSLDRRASALPKSKASQRNEPNYQFFYMSYYAAAHPPGAEAD